MHFQFGVRHISQKGTDERLWGGSPRRGIPRWRGGIAAVLRCRNGGEAALGSSSDELHHGLGVLLGLPMGRNDRRDGLSPEMQKK
jgi:hypothetical protein